MRCCWHLCQDICAFRVMHQWTLYQSTAVQAPKTQPTSTDMGCSWLPHWIDVSASKPDGGVFVTVDPVLTHHRACSQNTAQTSPDQGCSGLPRLANACASKFFLRVLAPVGNVPMHRGACSLNTGNQPRNMVASPVHLPRWPRAHPHWGDMLGPRMFPRLNLPLTHSFSPKMFRLGRGLGERCSPWHYARPAHRQARYHCPSLPICGTASPKRLRCGPIASGWLAGADVSRWCHSTSAPVPPIFFAKRP